MFPTVCVRTGVPTEHGGAVVAAELPGRRWWTALAGPATTAMVARLTGRPTRTIALPVAPEVWRTWRRRTGAVVMLTAAALALLPAGVIRANVGLVVGAFVILAVTRYLAFRWAERFWVGLELRTDQGDVVVTHVHERFDDDARRLYVAGVGRRAG